MRNLRLTPVLWRRLRLHTIVRLPLSPQRTTEKKNASLPYKEGKQIFYLFFLAGIQLQKLIVPYVMVGCNIPQ